MISFIESFVKELEQESAGTKKMLALVPADKSEYKPHEKSMALGVLATHVAEIPGWISSVLASDELDFSKTPYTPKVCNGGPELVAMYEQNAAEARANLEKHDDSVLEKTWTMRNGEQVFMQMSKLDTIRHCLCQVVHHRAQLGVYLRLLNIPIPGVYGPSADEPGGF